MQNTEQTTSKRNMKQHQKNQASNITNQIEKQQASNIKRQCIISIENDKASTSTMNYQIWNPSLEPTNHRNKSEPNNLSLWTYNNLEI